MLGESPRLPFLQVKQCTFALITMTTTLLTVFLCPAERRKTSKRREREAAAAALATRCFLISHFVNILTSKLRRRSPLFARIAIIVKKRRGRRAQAL